MQVPQGHPASTAFVVDQNSGLYYSLLTMAWTVVLKESVIDDLRWFGRKDGRLLLAAAEERLAADPAADTRNLKTLRPNPVAQRELRVFGKYRVLFNIDTEAEVVTIVLVGEKRGDALIVRGEEFTEHHEDHSSE
jgi:mRNA-degrading endonuclease RelE of RelBE toxin-antitoxin system